MRDTDDDTDDCDTDADPELFGIIPELFWFVLLVLLFDPEFWLVFELLLLLLFDVETAEEGINPFADVRIVPDKFWNWGVPAPALVDPKMQFKNENKINIFFKKNFRLKTNSYSLLLKQNL